MVLGLDGLGRREEAERVPGVWLGDWAWGDYPEMCSLGKERVWGKNELIMGLDECERYEGCLVRLAGPQRLMGKAVVGPEVTRRVEWSSIVSRERQLLVQRPPPGMREPQKLMGKLVLIP